MGGGPDPPRAVLALSPDGKWGAFALGNTVICLDRAAATAAPLPAPHAAPVRALAYSADSAHIASGGDDKAVIVRAQAGSWLPTSTWAAPKKVSAVSLVRPRPPAGRLFAIAGDKFGDVLSAGVPSEEEAAAAAAAAGASPHTHPPPHASFGHFCTILTSLAHAPAPAGTPRTDGAAGGWLASADGGGRLRVSALPADPTAHGGGYGIPEALAFCSGHTAFVTGVAWVGAVPPPPPPPPPGSAAGEEGEGSPAAPPFALSPRPAAPPPPGCLLASASGDGSVRLWRPADGALLATHWPTPAAAAHAAARSSDRAGIGARLAAKRAAAARAFAALSGAEVGGGGAPAEKVGAAAGADGDGDGNGDGGDDGDGDGDGPAADWSRGDGLRRPPPPAVIALAASPDGATLAAVVEGRAEVCLLRVGVEGGGRGGSLTPAGTLALPRVPRPTAIAFDPSAPGPGALWGVGVGEGGTGLVVGAAAVGGGGGGPSPLPPPGSAAVEAAVAAAAAVEAALPDPPLPPTREQLNLELRRTAALGEPRLDPRVLAAEAEKGEGRAKPPEGGCGD